jgi:L-cysteine:1D-myo-inositol 2-amino-2-deoxy-alpha-D-glucopyranoside ligase
MGHAATYLAFDTLQRAWRDGGSHVTYVQNITDIDDPLLERAAAISEDWQVIAAREIARFSDDMTSLRVLAPDHYVSVTEHMKGIIEWIDQLLKFDAAYVLEGDVYFDVSKSEVFGDVSSLDNLTMESVFAERGGDPKRVGKRNPLDALLWLAAREGEPSWEAHFGAGRPGWHIECVAIAIDYLGGTVTVQGGGKDLIFPHHEMCNAQAVASGNVEEFAKAYVHAGMVALDGEKMSKSRGNLVFISSLREQGIDPMVIRLAIISHKYCTDWEWTNDDLVNATQRIAHWQRALAFQGGADALVTLAAIRSALASDLDTPAAIQAVDEWATATINGDQSDETAQGIVARSLDSLLGIAL